MQSFVLQSPAIKPKAFAYKQMVYSLQIISHELLLISCNSQQILQRT